MPPQPDPGKQQCSLLLFLATDAEETGLQEAATVRGLPFEKIKKQESPFGEEYHWLGAVGDEVVIAVRPVRRSGRVVMGSIGQLGTAARGMRIKTLTKAQGIVQLGMAFGIDPVNQKPGDVLVSTSIIPYDNRIIKPAPRSWLCHRICGEGYVTVYPQEVSREPAQPVLVELFLRDTQRGGHAFGVHPGAILSGAARIQSRFFRDELVHSVPSGEDPIVGGEMEGVGLLAASTAKDDPIWCIVKGISDFADEQRDDVIAANRPVACRNAAEFLLSALIRDTER